MQIFLQTKFWYIFKRIILILLITRKQSSFAMNFLDGGFLLRRIRSLCSKFKTWNNSYFTICLSLESKLPGFSPIYWTTSIRHNVHKEGKLQWKNVILLVEENSSVEMSNFWGVKFITTMVAYILPYWKPCSKITNFRRKYLNPGPGSQKETYFILVCIAGLTLGYSTPCISFTWS